MKNFDREIFNIILIHTARTWERIRIKQPFQEMPLDNIESTDCIQEIATMINDDDVIQEFLKNRKGDIWIDVGGASDIYIEHLAEKIITNRHMNTEENNKLIAEFMGMTTSDNDESMMIFKTPKGNEIMYIDKLEYHTSWDWLMSVVEKIYKIAVDDENIEVFYEISDNLPHRHATYNAVLEFINRYNKNK